MERRSEVWLIQKTPNPNALKNSTEIVIELNDFDFQRLENQAESRKIRYIATPSSRKTHMLEYNLRRGNIEARMLSLQYNLKRSSKTKLAVWVCVLSCIPFLSLGQKNRDMMNAASQAANQVSETPIATLAVTTPGERVTALIQRFKLLAEHNRPLESNRQFNQKNIQQPLGNVKSANQNITVPNPSSRIERSEKRPTNNLRNSSVEGISKPASPKAQNTLPTQVQGTRTSNYGKLALKPKGSGNQIRTAVSSGYDNAPPRRAGTGGYEPVNSTLNGATGQAINRYDRVQAVRSSRQGQYDQVGSSLKGSTGTYGDVPRQSIGSSTKGKTSTYDSPPRKKGTGRYVSTGAPLGANPYDRVQKGSKKPSSSYEQASSSMPQASQGAYQALPKKAPGAPNNTLKRARKGEATTANSPPGGSYDNLPKTASSTGTMRPPNPPKANRGNYGTLPQTAGNRYDKAPQRAIRGGSGTPLPRAQGTQAKGYDSPPKPPGQRTGKYVKAPSNTQPSNKGSASPNQPKNGSRRNASSPKIAPPKISSSKKKKATQKTKKLKDMHRKNAMRQQSRTKAGK